MRSPHHRNTPVAALVALCLSASISVAAGCSAQAERDGSDQQIVATTGMVADIVRQVVGEHATVTGIMREGVDPHLYKPTRSDVLLLSGADIVFYNGLMLEGKMTDALVRIARTGRPVHAVTELLEDSYVMADPQQHYDPHVWMDVQGWARAVEVVAETMSAEDPANAAAYRANARRYQARLQLLDRYAREVIESIPEQQRVLVTAHDAFGYLGRAYGIQVRGIQGLSTESEAGVKDINDLVQFLVDRRVRAVFVETSVADKNVRALAEGAAARGHEVAVGGSLFSDAMGVSGTYEGTYVGMIDHNVTTIARALGGQAPDGGFRQWCEQRDAAVPISAKEKDHAAGS